MGKPSDMLGTKMLKNKKNMEITLYGTTKQFYQKRVFCVFISYLRTETLKCMQDTLYGETQKLYQKTCIFKCF